MPRWTDVAELVRLPAVLTVPGDAALGRAMAGGSGRAMAGGSDRAAALLTASSCSVYLAGMALNDYADRDVDAVERPRRPIPSGRVTPGFAAGLAGALTAASLGLAALSGRRALAVAVPLAATVWAYDLAVKDTPLGPFAMASARALDVLLGACHGDLRRALPAAGVVGGHTLLVTVVSRREVAGAGPALARGALGGTAAVTAAAAAVARGQTAGTTSPASAGRPGLPARRQVGAVLAAGLLTAHAVSMAGAELAAIRDPAPARLQRVVATGVLGLLPLQGAMTAAAGNPAAGALAAAAWPLARRLARKRSVT